jgi:hypothetical protein
MSENFSKLICDSCNLKLEQFSEFQKLTIENQKFLYQLEDEADDCQSSQDLLASLEQSDVENVVVKVELEDAENLIEFDEMKTETDLNEKFDDKPAAYESLWYDESILSNKSKPKKVERSGRVSQNESQKLPAGYKLCEICGKVLLMRPWKLHVRFIVIS